MSNNIKLEVGKKYLTRDDRVAAVSEYLEGRTYGFRGNVEGLATYEECWTSDGSWTSSSGHHLDLVSEYVETPSQYQRIKGLLDKHVAPAQPVAYRYFRYPERDDDEQRDVCVWRHAPGETYGTAKYIYRETDEWEDTGLTLEDNRLDPDMIECDENGVPLAIQQAAPVAFRYFTLENNDRSLQFFCVWRAADGDPDHVEASCPNNPGDTWTRTGHTLEELTDPAGYFVECDENGVPLSPPPAPEPRIPEGFIEVDCVLRIFAKDFLNKVLVRVSDIASVHEGIDCCTIGTTSGNRDYSVTESYTTVLEKINAALP